jgi:hypothetical protein
LTGFLGGWARNKGYPPGYPLKLTTAGQIW